ncbi:MAG: hypothetical protein FD155_1291 [Bacteroidetes bacterium]|nr:MAG: hypothetical protein FD155_1291 [Bacteroidota bacterium]
MKIQTWDFRGRYQNKQSFVHLPFKHSGPFGVKQENT